MTVTYTQLGKNGRLGNMLFQLSATVALALRNNDNYIFPEWNLEKNFNLHNCFSNTIYPTKSYTEPFFHYKTIPFENTKNEILDLIGYWQSYKYFEDCQDVITSLLTPKIGFGIKYGYTSIHVRRGDYTLNSDAHSLLDMDYYNQAINLINSQKYIIFSDDISWCKTKFIGDKFIFSENSDPITDLALQIACENNIIANSSFSWWGAFLNKNASKIVIAPKKWFGPKLPHDIKDLLPKEWVKI